jgi:hypothetical protein
MHGLFSPRRLIPLGISIILLAVVVWKVSPSALLEAAAQLNWPPLLLATAIMVTALYLWDAVCLPAVYRVEGQRLSYWQSLHLRGLSYLGGALNYELGQAALAWGMARLQQTGVVRMLFRSVLLAYHDILLLLAVGLIGSFLSDDPRAERLRPLVSIALAVTVGVGIVLWALPANIRARIRADGASVLDGWSLARSARLLPLRLVYFGILVIYAAIAMNICRLPVDRTVVVSTIPLVLLADGLPSFAGLGTRETSLQLVLAPGEPNAMLFAMSLFWSTGMIIGRIIIALAHLWGHHWHQPTKQERESDAAVLGITDR